jgi:hypothetical protein
MEISRAIPQVANSTAVSPQQSAVAAKPLTEAKQALAEAQLAKTANDLAKFEEQVRQQNRWEGLTPEQVTERAKALQSMEQISQEMMKEAARRT